MEHCNTCPDYRKKLREQGMIEMQPRIDALQSIVDKLKKELKQNKKMQGGKNGI
jgi:hypothetical protein